MLKLIVLGTYHDVQGLKKFNEKFSLNVDDPNYKTILRESLGHGVDFIFEEAAGEGPSVASEMLANDRYIDIDSETTEKSLSRFREQVETVLFFPPPLNLLAEDWREECWVKKIKAQQFETGLVICGVAHSLSIAFRLKREGFHVEVCNYEPIDRLCSTKKACPKLHSLAQALCACICRYRH